MLKNKQAGMDMNGKVGIYSPDSGLEKAVQLQFWSEFESWQVDLFNWPCNVRIYHYPEEWIGLRKSDADGEGFYWLDGTAVDHTNWQGGYPENATDGEECVIDATEYYGNGWKVCSMTKFSSLGQCRNTFVMYLSY